MPFLFKNYYPLRNLIFLGGESFLIFITFCLVHYTLLGNSLHLPGLTTYYIRAAAITFTCQICLYFYDLYDLSRNFNFTETVTRMTKAFGLGFIVLGATFYFLPETSTSIIICWPSYLAIYGIILLWRWAYNYIVKQRLFTQNILIIGTGQLASDITKVIEEKNDSAYKITNFLGDTEVEFNFHKAKILSEIPKMVPYCREHHIERIILALDDRRKKTPTRELLKCKLNGIIVEQGVSFYEGITGKLLVEKVDPSEIFFSDGFTLSRWAYLCKRILDISLSVFGLTLSLPITLLSSLIIKLESPGPVFYFQERVGKKGATFMVIKFRSMEQDAEKDGAVWAMENDTRVTRFGSFIRKARIDELPQMWNVLKGEMSFVGPRPERPVFVDQLTESIPYYAIRHYIKPGITGWAQVCYPYGASAEDALRKLEYDLYYMKNISIFMDLVVILQTVKTVIFRKGSR